eukprot:CAMPEP_0206539044 /NCGR_PEP_ID=MMETSP0325_2-20121206/8221_1 /ASSEMBLY_ACC=CAM_ASM_000347 /TAXON_ID=2866 /ORGANISM="Crypthecodinium cohnii, Strain Seligo" /LENGTH=230 /DNA_ID=CAMNT_0054036593 /DNA_START=199 /DNA_END=891 /DNA_ORIENTATION=-
MFICIPAALFAGFAFTDEDVGDCKEGTTVTGVNLGLSIAHVFMAFYLQTRLHYGLQHRDLPLSAEQSGDSAAPSEAKVLMQSAGKIVLYDVLFCLYVLIFAASFIYQFYILSWFFSCKEGGLVLGSAICLLMFSCMASSFGCCWWTAMMCGDFLSKGPFASCMSFLIGSRGDRASAQQPPAPPRQVVEGTPAYPQPQTQPAYGSAPPTGAAPSQAEMTPPAAARTGRSAV